ncbi:hypothetical protein [Roseivivax isoporae]|uniref:DUF2497 domain-containing protein n=1 Tax=Roseivivax isoporae LMG 25204 TaxID=1449351 RepID=X7F9K5_9RHOB|nr:hypothetical protein [Roseivivax isoporae]ETX28796.1 hypothetical protein RISW2_04660 [Roseivivax isoporae LMG 25204]
MKNVDIEDVLSSIRRLVAEDGGLGLDRPRAEPRADARPEAPEALILTPQQRVPEDEPDATEDAPATRRDTNEGSDADGSREAIVSGLGGMVREEFEFLLKRLEADEAATTRGAPGVAGAEAPTPPARDLPRPTLVDLPDTAAPEDEEEADPEPLRLLRPALRVRDESAPDDVPEAEAPRSARRLEQKIAELEAMIAETDGDWEPEPLSPVAEPLRPAEPPRPAAAAPREEPKPQPQARAANDDAPMFDEDMLREMVAEIVRSELQGALGERITRNVRKLVRREIHRALNGQSFD